MAQSQDSSNIMKMDAERTNIANMLIQQIKTGNKIYSQQRRECKVCLLGEAEVTQPLIHPCACPSMFQLVHLRCFIIWITDRYTETELLEKLQSDTGFICEQCKGSYIFYFQIQKTCVQWPMFKNKIKKSKIFAALNISFILVVAFLLTLACIYAILDRKHPQYDIFNPRFFIVFIAIGLGVLSLAYGIYQFVKTFVIYRQLKVSLPLNMSRVDNFESNHPQNRTEQKQSKSENGLIIPPQLHKQQYF